MVAKRSFFVCDHKGLIFILSRLLLRYHLHPVIGVLPCKTLGWVSPWRYLEQYRVDGVPHYLILFEIIPLPINQHHLLRLHWLALLIFFLQGLQLLHQSIIPCHVFTPFHTFALLIVRLECSLCFGLSFPRATTASLVLSLSIYHWFSFLFPYFYVPTSLCLPE